MNCRGNIYLKAYARLPRKRMSIIIEKQGIGG